MDWVLSMAPRTLNTQTSRNAFLGTGTQKGSVPTVLAKKQQQATGRGPQAWHQNNQTIIAKVAGFSVDMLSEDVFPNLKGGTR